MSGTIVPEATVQLMEEVGVLPVASLGCIQVKPQRGLSSLYVHT